ncbi:MAG: secretin and TonB N-terminal domain-containing protein [Thermodesulfovibrionales bacterium]
MKMKIFFLLFSIILIFLAGCAAPPEKDRTTLPSEIISQVQPPPHPEERLNELLIPQREEEKKIPEKLYSLFVRDADVQEVLLAFSKESDLNIVIDPELKGKVTIDLKKVTLKEVLDSILTPLGWTYRTEGKFIKIIKPQLETRFFTLNYIATKRGGKREVYASTGGGTQTALMGQQGGTVTGQTITGGGARTGYSDLISVDELDLWNEIQKGLEAIVFGSAEEKKTGSEAESITYTKVDEKGKKLIINKSTGVICVTDYPVNLNKVASFLEAIEGSSQRQVTIQAKILEVILNDEHRTGINWEVIENLPRFVNLGWGLTDKTGTTGFPGSTTGYLSGDTTGTTTTTASTIPTPNTFTVKPFGGVFLIGAGGTEVLLSDIMEAISLQGEVRVLSNPTISTLNNQKAIIRVGDQDVFFITGAVSTQYTVTQYIQPMTIDIGIILDVTPQIAEDGTIIMNIHPSITEKTGEKKAPDGRSTFPILSVRETDTTVRVRDGQTVIIAGLMQEKTEKTYTGVPFLQSLPVLGNLFRYRTETKRNSELVIMITPTLQIGKKVEDLTQR